MKSFIAINGTITKAFDYNTEEILKDLPLKPRNQIIELILDEDFWQILFLKNKKIKIIIDKDDLPKEIL